MHKPESVFENEMHKILSDFEVQTNHISGQKTKYSFNQLEEKNLTNSISQRERERKQKVGHIPGPCQRAEKIVGHMVDRGTNCSWVQGTVSKVLEKKLTELSFSERIETVQITALVKLAKILRRVWWSEEIWCHSDFNEKATVRDDVKNLKIIIIIIIIIKEDNFLDLAKIWKSCGTCKWQLYQCDWCFWHNN